MGRIRTLGRRLPGIAWRDAKIDRLEAELRSRGTTAPGTGSSDQSAAATSKRALLPTDRNSFRARMLVRSRDYGMAASLEAHPYVPVLQAPHKLFSGTFAASHGILTPEILGVWHTVDEIDLEGLPDEFVFKSDRGSNSRAVFPLRRVAPGRYRLVGGSADLDLARLKERIGALGRLSSPPYFAEEMIPPGPGAVLPDDVKVFAFHGEIVWTMLRRVPGLTSGTQASLRFVDADGEDLGPIGLGRKHDDSIPLPPSYPQVVEVARHLSRASGVDFCRVDVYTTDRGPVFGELTVTPGGHQRYPAWADERAGKAWARAIVRLAEEESRGRPRGFIFGEAPATWHYRESENPVSPGAWPRTILPCSQWCGTTGD